MRSLVSAWLDGKLTGVLRWYTEWHMAHCPQCAASIPFFRSLQGRLRILYSPGDADEGLSADRWASIASAFEAVEAEAATQASGDGPSTVA